METDIHETKRTKIGSQADTMGQPEAVLEDRYTDPISLDAVQLQVIVCPKSATDSMSDVDILDSIASKFPALGKPVLVKVPQNPPLTRTQYQDAIKYWPVSFHEDKRVTSLLSGHFFSSSEVRTIHAHMKTVLRLAKIAKEKGQVAIGAVVVDPSTDTVLASAHDLRQGHNPLQHAVMVVVDLVARGQGGGMWDIQDSDMKHHTTADTLIPPSGDGSTKVGPYLCTGYDLYVNSEPCIMCAMSLVHSRIGRVFYSTPHPEGALGTRYKLHVQPGLNHHYQVFRGALGTQCLNLDQHR